MIGCEEHRLSASKVVCRTPIVLLGEAMVSILKLCLTHRNNGMKGKVQNKNYKYLVLDKILVLISALNSFFGKISPTVHIVYRQVVIASISLLNT